MNKGFLDSEDALLKGVDKIKHLPGMIVQGRYDVVCPPETAWELYRAWPEAVFDMLQDAGHSMSEVSIARRLVAATDHFVDQRVVA